MGIMSLIKEKKREFETERTVNKASKLKALREERLRVEGQVKVNKLYDKEKARIKKAKKERFESSKTGKFISGLKKYNKAAKVRGKKMPKKTGKAFGDQEINEAFSLGSGNGKKKRFFYE